MCGIAGCVAAPAARLTAPGSSGWAPRSPTGARRRGRAGRRLGGPVQRRLATLTHRGRHARWPTPAALVADLQRRGVQPPGPAVAARGPSGGRQRHRDIVEALARWGEDAIARCNGLFAYAAPTPSGAGCCWCATASGSSRCTVARHDGALWFASEIGALLRGCPAARARRRAPPRRGDGLGHGREPVEGIDRVMPGTVVSVAWTHARHRRAELVRRAGRCWPRAEGSVEDVLRRAVRRRLMSDVPLARCAPAASIEPDTAMAPRRDGPRLQRGSSTARLRRGAVPEAVASGPERAPHRRDGRRALARGPRRGGAAHRVPADARELGPDGGHRGPAHRAGVKGC